MAETCGIPPRYKKTVCTTRRLSKYWPVLPWGWLQLDHNVRIIK